MSILLVCACGKSAKFRDELAGRRTQCPACGAVLPVPAPAPIVEEDGGEEAPTKELPDFRSGSGRTDGDEDRPKKKKRKNNTYRSEAVMFGAFAISAGAVWLALIRTFGGEEVTVTSTPAVLLISGAVFCLYGLVTGR
jgi:hypothetical protein